jgi:hypothetical protein
VGAITLFLVYWIFHNRRIARKYPRRRTRKAAPDAPVTDFLGRALMTPSAEELSTANYIEVHVVKMSGNGEAEQEHKVFRTREATPE